MPGWALVHWIGRIITPPVPRLPLVPLLAALACLVRPGFTVEPSVATPFDVRHDADELLDDLQANRGDAGALLERVQHLIAAHGNSMISKGDLCAPLAEVFTRRLDALGLSQDFARTYAGIADRRMREALAAGAPEADLRLLALSFPGTDATRSLWRRLANRAWDGGRLGLYLDYAAHAGERDDRVLAERIAAARRLLAPAPIGELTTSLDGLEEMWRIDADAGPNRPPATPQRQSRRIRRIAPTSPSRYVLAAGPGELSAASDGQHIFVFDHLIGRRIGEVRALGGAPVAPIQARPAVIAGGFVASGWVDDHGILVAIDRLGEVRWRANTPQLGPLPALSAPVVLDDLVVVGALAITGQEGAELRVMAFRADSGKQAWNTLVARIPIPRQLAFGLIDGGLAAPVVTAHAGSLLVLSNSGVLARIGIDGNVNRLWSYPTTIEELDDGLANGQRPARSSGMVSDGTWAVATPSDNPSLSLVIGPDGGPPVRYQGDGANGSVLDVHAGKALVASRSVLSLVDLASGRATWTQPLAARDGAQGRIAGERALVATVDQMSLIDLADGRTLSARGLGTPVSIAVTSDLVMAATDERIIGWGRGASFLERLTRAAAEHPNDFQPWGTLASFHESRNEHDKAFVALTEALTRGAPADYAERAARLVRTQLELAIGDEKAFPGPLAKLASLAAFDERLKGEASLWRGRHAELRGDAGAVAHYRSALAAPDHLMQLRDRLEIEAHALAHAGLARLGAGVVARPPTVSPPLPKPAMAWQLAGSRGEQLTVTGDVAVGFDGGFLTGVRVTDGKELWRRTPVRQLLGVRSDRGFPQDQPDGIPIEKVVPGSSAAGAGMRDGDVLTSFNGRKTSNFERDLRLVVAGMAPRDPFTLTVLRDGNALSFTGLLGGEPLEPIAANQRTVLAWLTTPISLAQQPQRMLAAPEGMWFAVVDLASGTDLFRQSLRPATEVDETPPRPLLTTSDHILTLEGADLVCLPAHSTKLGEPAPAQPQAQVEPQAQPQPLPLWRLPLGENGLDLARLIAPDLLWLPEDGRTRVQLVDVTTGRPRVVLPEDIAAESLLVAGCCYCLGSEGRISCWDLGLGRLRWRTEKVYGKLIAVAGDGVYVSDEANQLTVLDTASGQVRRRFGEWTTIDSWVRDERQLAVHVRRDDRSQALALITLPGGAIQWEHAIPRTVELQRLALGGDAVVATLGEPQQASTVLAIGRGGELRLAARLTAREIVVPVTDAVLASGPGGLRALPFVGQPAAQPPVPCLPIEVTDLAALDPAKLPKLAWQPVGKSAFALARSRSSLLVFARLAANAPGLDLLIGDSGPAAIDAAGQTLSIRPRGAQLMGLATWQLAGSTKLPDESQGIVLVARLEPPAGRAPGAGLLVRAISVANPMGGDVSEGPDAPWWLRSAWRPVVGGP